MIGECGYHARHGHPTGYPPGRLDRILLSTILKNSSKHYYSQGLGGASVRDQVEIAAVVQGSTQAVRQHPCFSMVVCLVSPLVHPAERVQEIMECAASGSRSGWKPPI